MDIRLVDGLVLDPKRFGNKEEEQGQVYAGKAEDEPEEDVQGGVADR